jgi:hypothetical protein
MGVASSKVTSVTVKPALKEFTACSQTEDNIKETIRHRSKLQVKGYIYKTVCLITTRGVSS